MLREDKEELEYKVLAHWAMHNRESKGRRYDEPKHPYRVDFERDRERIIHSTAFRRLEYKTQVFVNHEGDHYRTRMTHTLEVATMARSIARALSLNEDLAEAIALAHDIGHTPFGHIGEITLNDLMKENGGFEHNRHGLRIVEKLEERYPNFPGLNLTFEVREGIIKHHTAYDKAENIDYEPQRRPPLEAQIVDIADQIAYYSHDLDDGLRSNLFTLNQLEGISLRDEMVEELKREFPAIDEHILRYQMIRKLINREVTDCIETSRQLITESGMKTVEDVRNAPDRLITISSELKEKNQQLQEFLEKNMYRHPKVLRMALKSKKVIEYLFNCYMEEPKLISDWEKKLSASEGNVKQIVSDHIAGMTDRFAMMEYKKLSDPFERLL